MAHKNEPIIKEIEIWKETIQTNNQIRFVDFTIILDRFEDFCNEYFDEIFVDERPNSEFDRYAVNNILFEYWEPLRQTIMQHMADSYQQLLEKGYQVLQDYEGYLRQELKVPTEIPAILYFEKMGKAKRYPFQGIYLIGIPLADAYNDNWVSIAHEIGHHIYWNARFNKQDTFVVPPPGKNFFDEDIEKSLETVRGKNKKKLVRLNLEAWTEEIFADIIGTRIAKEKYADSTWNRIVTRIKSTSDLFNTDGEHPIPYLTPYICSFVLGKPFDENKWKRYQPISVNVDKKKSKYAVRVEVLLNSIEVYIKGINGRLHTIRMDPWHPSSGGSSFSALKEFIMINDASLQDPEVGTKEAFRTALLKPRILDRAVSWICVNCRHENPSNNTICSNCHLPTKLISTIIAIF